MVKNEIIKSSAAATAVCACFLLTACGGGGGGGSSAAATGRMQLLPFLAAPSAQEKTAEASASTPKAGSVTQSSNRNTGAAGNPTLDQVEGVVTGISPQETLLFSLTQTNSGSGAWTVTQDDVRRYVSSTGTRFYGAEMSKRVTLNSAAGNLYVEAYTDYEIARAPGGGFAADSDYLAGGIWLFVRDDNNQIESAGAFAGGSQPFMQSEVAALTGSANYDGDAFGVWAGDDRSNGYFDADVALTANFDGGDANRGIISGRVFNVTVNGRRADIALNLQEGRIGGGDSGFFTGETEVVGPNITDGNGKWGGQFFGNAPASVTDSARRYPGSLAGTFGGEFSENDAGTVIDYGFLGVFGATLSTPRE